MPISAKIICDSIGPSGVRLTTFDLIYPRFIHAEIMTHRAFSRNSASSRAIPAKKLRERTMTDPAMPVWWGKNQPGMQANEQVEDIEAAKNWWLRGLELMERHHAEGESRGYHKQIVNRLIEPYMMIEVIMTADQFGLAQMFHQRRHKDAQPEFQALANAMWEEYNGLRAVQRLAVGQWHLPFIDFNDALDAEDMALNGRVRTEDIEQEVRDKATQILKAVSVGRCARVSYLNHNGERSLQDDIDLHDKLKIQVPGHFSPFEHVATPLAHPDRVGNFTGWLQYRKEFPNENLPVYEDK